MICQNMVWLAWPPPLLRTERADALGQRVRAWPAARAAASAARSPRLRGRGVEIVDVGRVVPAVVDLHRLGVDMRLVLVRRVGQRIELERARRRLRVGAAGQGGAGAERGGPGDEAAAAEQWR